MDLDTYTLAMAAKVGFDADGDEGFADGFDPFTLPFPFPFGEVVGGGFVAVVEAVLLSMGCCFVGGGEVGLLLGLVGPVGFAFCCCSRL
jgi:hypothetical protein